MKRSDKQLYERIMRNVSREIKRVLNEDIQKFDTSDYRDEEQDLISDHEIDDIIDPVTALLTKALSIISGVPRQKISISLGNDGRNQAEYNMSGWSSDQGMEQFSGVLKNKSGLITAIMSYFLPLFLIALIPSLHL